MFLSRVYISTGPLGSLGAKKLGCRKACFLGGIVLGSGFIASVFTQSPLQLFFTVGLVTGKTITPFALGETHNPFESTSHKTSQSGQYSI